jgi:hypothetical protein
LVRLEATVVYPAGIGSVDRHPPKCFPLGRDPGGHCLQLGIRQIFVGELFDVKVFIGKPETPVAARKQGDGPLSLPPDMLGLLLLVPLAIDPARCSWAGEPFGLTRRFLDVLMKLAEATGNLYLIATVLSGVSLRGGIVTREMFAAYWRRLETMGISDTDFRYFMDTISGGEFSPLMEANKAQAGTIESQAGTIESLTGTVEELEAARGAAVLTLYDVGKSPEEISKLMKLTLPEVFRILGNGRGE